MKRNVWIMNHYATDMYFNKGGRHYWFAENLKKKGYNPTIFCASTRHNNREIIDTKGNRSVRHILNRIPFIFVRTPKYKGNGKSRIKNMISFYRNLFPVTKQYAKEYGKPDVILASSVHPLTLVAGIKIAKKFGVPCICEVRDLWPETFVSYGIMKETNPILKLLFWCERWIYKKADKIIFTMEGGKDYIVGKRWDKENGGPVSIGKVYHINNGIDIDVFNYNKKNYTIEDKDLENKDIIKIVYTGSIRKVNNLDLIVETAKNITDPQIKFLIWGDGDERVKLEEKCKQERVENVIFKGAVEKKYIPYILSNADINFLHGQYTPIMEYGMSANKLFDYIAAQKPILSDLKTNYDIILKYKLGVVTQGQSPQDIREGIQDICNMNLEEKHDMNENFIEAMKEYDYKSLTNKLIEII